MKNPPGFIRRGETNNNVRLLGCFLKSILRRLPRGTVAGGTLRKTKDAHHFLRATRGQVRSWQLLAAHHGSLPTTQDHRQYKIVLTIRDIAPTKEARVLPPEPEVYSDTTSIVTRN